MKQLENILSQVNKKSEGKLLGDISILEYLIKLKNNAVIIVSNNKKGFIAFYANDPKIKTIFISMICVLEEGHGSGSELLKDCFAYAHEKGFCEVRLEVQKWNEVAFGFYKKFGFSIENENTSSYFMSKKI